METPRVSSLVRNVLRRTRADWPVVLGAWLLLLCATTVLAAGALYADAVAIGGLRRVIEDAPPGERNVLVWTSFGGDIGALDTAVTERLRSLVEPNGGAVVRVVRDSWLSPEEGSPASGSVTGVAGHDRLADHATLAAGAWPRPGRIPVEASLAAAVAEQAGVDPGDRVRLIDPRTPDRVLEVTIAGTWQPIAGDPYWQTIDGDEDARLAGGRGPIVVAFEDAVAAAQGRSMGIEWRVLPSTSGLAIEDVDALRRDVETLQPRLAGAVEGVTFTVRSGLGPLLAATARSVIVSRGGVLVLVGQFAVLAAYAISLVAGILLDRRRSAIALLEARGAGASQLGAMALGEAVLLAIPTVLVAPALGVAVVRALDVLGPFAGSGLGSGANVGPMPVAASAIAAGAGIVGLTLPSLVPRPAPGRVRAEVSRPAGRTLPQRLGLDLALVVVAAVGLWQLRLYGAPLTRDTRGVLGIDPLLVAAPAIGLLAGAVLAVRILPRLADLAEGLFARRTGLVLPLGAKQVSRRPLRYTRAAMLLLLASALGTFASLYAATWSRSQGDQAAYRAATDVRMLDASIAATPEWVTGAALRAIEGVDRVTSVVRQPIDVGRSLRGGQLVGISPAAAAKTLVIPPVIRSSTWTEVASVLEAARPVAGRPIPSDTVSLVLAVDTALELDDGSAATRPLATVVLVRDEDGRVLRIDGGDLHPAKAGQRIAVSLAAVDAGPAIDLGADLSLLGVELIASAQEGSARVGRIHLRSVDVETAEGTTGLVTPDTDGWSWAWGQGGALESLRPTPGAPGRLDIGGQEVPPLSEPVGSQTTFRWWMAPHLAEAAPGLAGSTFAERVGAEVGDRLNTTINGQVVAVDVVGIIESLPPLDPEAPVMVLDAGTLDIVRLAATGEPMPTAEWWIDADDGAENQVLEQVSGPPFAFDEIFGRLELAQANASDPLGLGIIGALVLGAAAALVVGAIGFVVAASVSTRERMDEFAILRALGLSSRQLTTWLGLEHAFLLLLGVLVGALLGLVLAWLVLPFATFTTTGLAPVPEPAIVVPWAVLLPSYALAVLLLIVTLVVIRRQLGGLRMSDVLRGHDL